MITDFIDSYAKLLVLHENDIEVIEEVINETFIQITIYANKEDLGKLIGKSGNMINSLKTVINACKVKNSISYKIQVNDIKDKEI